jgi:hypothetical protein
MHWQDVILASKNRRLLEAARDGLLTDAEIDRLIEISDDRVVALSEQLDREEVWAREQARRRAREDVACRCECADCAKLRNWSIAAFDNFNR